MPATNLFQSVTAKRVPLRVRKGSAFNWILLSGLALCVAFWLVVGVVIFAL